MPDGAPDGKTPIEAVAAPGGRGTEQQLAYDRLRHAGLVGVRRDGRSTIYGVRSDAMNDVLVCRTENG